MALTMKSFKIHLQASVTIVLTAARGALMICLAFACAAHAAPAGEVTLVIGRALLVPLDGEPSQVLRSSPINVGDRIETSEGGHVHIRFVDGAMVSVRPTSRLVVEDYQYNPQHVAQSLVRFRLEKGVVRAISGAAAEGAKDRFRLNTPLVAIGVRGTDFVVRTQTGQTVATVNQGAIVMAPFGSGCLRQASGPCGSASGKLLSAEMGSMLVEFKNSSAQAELKPFNAFKTPEILLASAQVRPVTDPATSREAVKPIALSSGDEAVSVALVQTVVRKAGDLPLVPPVSPMVPAIPVAPVAPGLPSDTESPIKLPNIPVIPVITEPAQLAWGRWAGVAMGATDFAVARLDAREGRTVTVGDDNFVLYRAESGAAVLSQSLGNVDFGLQQAYARFTSSALEVLPATVEGGRLSVDFASRQFNTSLNLMSPATGSVNLQAAGAVRDDGLFVSRNAAQSVAGAFALDGKSAGYLFEKAAARGTLSGITLWSR